MYITRPQSAITNASPQQPFKYNVPIITIASASRFFFTDLSSPWPFVRIESNRIESNQTKSQVSELPLKNFYRLVLGPASGSVASFEGLPTRDTLTQRLDTPEPWNVQASAALQDLDNLR